MELIVGMKNETTNNKQQKSKKKYAVIWERRKH